MEQIEIEVAAYSPYDAIDRKYRASHPIPKTATNTDATIPCGIAADFKRFPPGTLISIPGYLNEQFVRVDDTGRYIRKAAREGRVAHIEVRFKTEAEALRWGAQQLTIKVIFPERK